MSNFEKNKLISVVYFKLERLRRLAMELWEQRKAAHSLLFKKSHRLF